MATLTIVYQLNYMQKNVGFAHEQLVVIPGPQVGKRQYLSLPAGKVI
ncbi:MAG: hypothetical protein IPF93_15115 [Saprospiraceae bacterium]|nr:hypothetical protein [Saprospiraceae bacterium]